MRVIGNFLDVVFAEVPGEISLAISVCGCGKSCPGCHTPELQNVNNGTYFSLAELKALLKVYEGYITCVLFFGGDISYEGDLVQMLEYIKTNTTLKTCLYTGNSKVKESIHRNLDYLKVGEYREDCGGLASTSTNQRFYCLTGGLKDITYKFWRE